MADGHDTVLNAADNGQDNTDHANNAKTGSSVDEQLRAQEAFYRTIIEGAADVTTLNAPDGTILYASASIAEPSSLGYPPELVIGHKCFDIIHPDDRQGVMDAIANDLAGRPTTVEARALKSDGTWVWVEMRGKAVVGLDGKTIIVAYSRNIDDRKRLQEHLEKSEQYYKSLLLGSSDLITVTDQAGTVRFVSDSIQRILGYRAEDAIGRNIFTFVHEDDLALATERLTKSSESPNQLVELRIRRKDGTWCPCEETGRIIVGPDGEPLVLINVRDISERKAVDREHALLAAIVESSEDAIVSNSLDQRITTWNKGAELLLGYTAEEAIGQHASLYMPPEWRAWGEKFLDDLMKQIDHVQSFEVPCLCKDGRVIDVWTVCGPIRDRSGKLVGISAIHRDLTEHKRLDREKVELAAIVNASNDAIIGFSRDLQMTSWNPAAERLYGYSAAEAVGHGFDLFVPADQLPPALAADRRLLETGVPQTFEQVTRRRDGSSVTSLVNVFPIRDLDGNIIGGAGIGHDITERKRIESENAALAAIVESSDDAISSIGLDHRVTYWNPGAEKMFGLSAAEVIGQPLTRFVVPENLAVTMRIVDRLIAHPEEVFRFEGPSKKKDGTPLEVSTVSFAIRNHEGQVIGISSIQRDLTARKRAEREAALLAAVVNASHDAIISVSPETKIISWNPAATTLYGYTAKEAIGQGLELFIQPEELAETAERSRRVAETGEPVSWEQRARHRDGSPFVVAVSIFPIFDSDGKVSSVAGIGRDITALKETERQLVAAREAALAASQAKSEFLASMSHEIRTPMTAILGMAELLGEGELNAEQRRYIEILDNNGHALLDLINSILDLAKIESGRLTLEHIAFDLGEVVVKASQTLAIRAHAKGLDLIVDIAPDVPTAVLGDPLRLRQVLINLIGNAIKFTERGEVLISVKRDSAEGEPLRLKFSVCDTGIGIAKDKLPLLFEAFSQADSSTARKYGGSGLGLAIVKRLVDLMQGEVTLESELGKGSTFSFTSPFELDPSSTAGVPSWPDLTQVPVLLVLGNETERRILRRMLNGRSADVAEVASYEEGSIVIARAVANGRPPRLVLLDTRIGSPTVSAMEQLIAAASQCGASIIAIIHCDNLAADTARLKSLKLDNYLIKPIDMRELARVVRRVIVGGDTVEAPEIRRSVRGDGGQPPIVDRPLKILFADDSIDNRILIRTFLKKTPYHLDEVENGRQAIDGFIAAGDYDLVLMDIQMPEVDGYAAARAIRDWEREHSHTHTPIIALTASVFPEAIRLAEAAGCDGHLGKPIGKRTLLSAIYDAVTCASDA